MVVGAIVMSSMYVLYAKTNISAQHGRLMKLVYTKTNISAPHRLFFMLLLIVTNVEFRLTHALEKKQGL